MPAQNHVLFSKFICYFNYKTTQNTANKSLICHYTRHDFGQFVFSENDRDLIGIFGTLNFSSEFGWERGGCLLMGRKKCLNWKCFVGKESE